MPKKAIDTSNQESEQLKQIIHYLRTAQVSIAVRWLREPKVTSIFLKHNISRKKFIPTFAVKIVNYFANVLDEKEKVGQCPAMSRFVDYMSEKEIATKEIFLICMAFRASMFLHLKIQGLLKTEDIKMIARLSEVFDLNLSGVLDHFSKIYAQKEKKHQEKINIALSLEKTQTILNLQDNIILKIKNNKIFLANTAFFKALNIANLDEFYKKFPRIWNFISEVDTAKKTFAAQKYELWFEEILASKNLILQVKFFNHDEKRESLYHVKIKRLSEFENGYIITMDDISEHQTEIDKLIKYVYIDPITNIYNRWKFDESLEASVKNVQKGGQALSLIVINIDDLNHINNMYGYAVGTQLLQDTAQQLQNNFSKHGVLARIESDRFGLILNSQNREKMLELADEIKRSSTKVTYQENLNPVFNIAIVSYVENDTPLSLLNRASKIIEDVIESSSCFIKDDHAMLKELRLSEQQAEAFVKTCQDMLESDQKLPVINYFKEIPIKSDAVIYGVEANAITLSVRKISVAALHLNDYLYIKMPAGEQIKARVIDIDRDVYTITIDSFKLVKHSPLERKNLQVTTDGTTSCFIKLGDTQIVGNISTISIDTVSIILPHIYALSLESHVQVDTLLLWENKKKHFLLEGVIFKMTKIGNEFNVLISLDISEEIKEAISAYIVHRQLITIQELQRATY